MVKKHRYRVDLSAQMADCDANYFRLLQLMPDLMDRDVWEFALASGAANLIAPGEQGEVPRYRARIRVVERSRYTSEVTVTQVERDELKATGERNWLRPPRFLVRMYHDACTAEVIKYLDGGKFAARYEYPNDAMRQPNEKAQVNRVLAEYLSFCLATGLSSRPPELPHDADGDEPEGW